MEALDLESGLPHPTTPNTPAMSFPPSASSSSIQKGHMRESSTNDTAASQPALTQQKSSSGPHIRSRITVVCAECKRLKLKCDRRTPCSSCLKRDTVSRCVYSQAAAEKVDVQTLHNRVIELERIVAALQADGITTSGPGAVASSLRQSAAISGPSRAGPSSTHPGLIAGLPCNDRALLAQGASGSSVVINLEDVVGLWLSVLEDDNDDDYNHQDTNSSPIRPSTSSAGVKLEPTSASIPASSSASGSKVHLPVGGLRSLHPPVSYDTFLPPPSEGPCAMPQVTAALVSHLPSEPERSRYLKAFRETMLLHPCFNVPNFEQRIAAVFSWAEGGSVPVNNGSISKADLARDIFFSGGKPNGTGKQKEQNRPPGPPPGPKGPDKNAPKPTLSFFAAACSAFALGALVARDEDPASTAQPGSGSVPSPPSPTDAAGTSATLFALSEQALQLFEKTAAYDLDSVMAMILQVLFMLHEGQTSVAQNVYPLVGKLVNVARMMGLAMDPDEFPGTYSLFEAEARRRLWWDVYCYDLFVADCMGQPPLIADNTHTTRVPADVDEEKFTPSSTSLPVPENADSDVSSVYFGLKCRLAQLLKNVKKQTFRDPLGEDAFELSIDQAGAFEGDVSVFLQDLPAGFRLEMTEDMSKPLPPPSGSPFRLAQKCELAILANRLIIKLYLPFLKEAAATRKPSHQAIFGTVTAAHNIVYASRLLHSVWSQARPAMFDFYDFGRALFDAAVVCAHAVIQEPMSIIANEGMKSVACALDILTQLDSSRVGVEGARAGPSGFGSRSEAVKIVQAMKRKAEAARSGGSVAGTKRKHSEVEPEPLITSSGFQLPFVGASVNSSRADAPRAAGASSSARAGPSSGKDATANGEGKSSRPEAKKQAKEKDKGKEKSGTKLYDGPLRVRPMTGQPAPRRPRTASVSTAAGTTPAPAAPPAPSSSRAAPSPMLSTIKTSVASTPSRASGSVPESPSVTTPYDGYPNSAPTTGSNVQQEDYQMQYSSGDDVVDDRRFSANSYDSPPAGMYDPQQQQPQPQNRYPQQSPAASYAPPPSQQEYYMSYGSSTGPTSAYENGPVGHAHAMGISMMSPPATMDTSGAGTGSIAPAMTTMAHRHDQQHPQQQQQTQQHYMPPPQDRSHRASYGQAHEYPQPPPSSHGHGHPHAGMSVPSHVQGWPQQGEPVSAPPAEMWNEYKYYGGLQG